MRYRRFVLLLVVVSLWTGAAVGQQASTSSIIPRIVNLPVVNLASSETAQISVVNLAPSVMSVAIGGGVPTQGITASCTGGITFFGPTGTAIGAGASFTVGSGQIFSASLPYADISQNNVVSANGGRTPIRAVVTVTQTVGSGVSCSLASSLETYDTSTGVTNVHIDGGQVTFSGIGFVPLDKYGKIH
jgi:hypothetical protein